MLIGSLFSGIGGLELGVLAAFSEAGIPARVAWQVEIDPFCRAVLARHFPDADRSVIDVRAASTLRHVDLIIGGFPCQDLSGAGKGAGLSGERSGLWWAFRDVIRALRPRAVLVENVASGLPRWHGPVRCSLEAMGYRTRARQISAADVGAPHRRERVFVLAYTGRERCRLESRGDGGALRAGAACARERCEIGMADAHINGRESERGGGLLDGERAARGRDTDGCGCARLGDAGCEGRSRASGERVCGARGEDAVTESSGRFGEAQRGLGRGAHGLPAGLDLPSRWPAGRGEEQEAWEPPRTVTGKHPLRRPRLKALGNGVVPAQAREAMRWGIDVLHEAGVL